MQKESGMHALVVEAFAEPGARLSSIHLPPCAVTPGLGFHFDCHAGRSQPPAHPCAEGPGDAVRNFLLKGLKSGISSLSPGPRRTGFDSRILYLRGSLLHVIHRVADETSSCRCAENFTALRRQ